MNVKEMIWGNRKKRVVEKIDEENGEKVEVMKLNKEIELEGWTGEIKYKTINIYLNILLVFPINTLFKLLTNSSWKGLTI